MCIKLLQCEMNEQCLVETHNHPTLGGDMQQPKGNSLFFQLCASMCVCVCVCIEVERSRGGKMCVCVCVERWRETRAKICVFVCGEVKRSKGTICVGRER